MKIDQLLTEHKKGVKAVKYAKKPQPLVGPEALKKKAKAKAAPPKSELEKHSKLTAKLEGVTEGSGGAKYKVKSIGKDSKGDYYISPNSGKKVYKQAKVGDHETPSGEIKPKVAEATGDPKFDKMLKGITGKKQVAKQQKADTKQQARGAFDNMFGGGNPADKLGIKKKGVAEGSVQDKLHKRHQELRKKSGLPDPDYYKELKATYDLPDEERYAKAAELKKKYKVKDMKEAKQPETPKPRNFVAKNAKTAGAGQHKDAKKASKEIRGQKHKNKEMAEGSETNKYHVVVVGHKRSYDVWVDAKNEDVAIIRAQQYVTREHNDTTKRAAVVDMKKGVAETYDQARADRIRYALLLKEGEWDQQSDEMIPPQYDMDPEELKAIRNAEFTEQDKIQAMIKLAAGGTSDEDIAKIYDMDKETVASILDDYVEEIEAETEQDADVKEAEMGKVVDYKPGVSATIDTGPGMTTMLDLKKNPTSLTKDPQTGKLKLLPGTAATAQPSATTQSTVKPGDQVEIPKTTTQAAEDILRLAGLR